MSITMKVGYSFELYSFYSITKQEKMFSSQLLSIPSIYWFWQERYTLLSTIMNNENNFAHQINDPQPSTSGTSNYCQNIKLSDVLVRYRLRKEQERILQGIGTYYRLPWQSWYRKILIKNDLKLTLVLNSYTFNIAYQLCRTDVK